MRFLCIKRKKKQHKKSDCKVSNKLPHSKTNEKVSGDVFVTINNNHNFENKSDQHKIQLKLNETPVTYNKSTDNRDDASSICSSVGPIIGFNNPQGYCFLNSVVQLLRSCKHFNKALLAYHKDSKIAESKETNVKKEFVNDICKLMLNLKNGKDINSVLSSIQTYFSSSATGDDVNKCFLEILNTINNVSRTPIPGKKPSNDVTSRFNAFKNANNGFVFDCFYGQLVYTTFCVHCNDVVIKNFQLFNSLPLPVPESSRSVTLLECIELFCKSSQFSMDIPMICKCKEATKNCALQTKITHGPRYLFIYLDRGSHYGKMKNPTFVTSDEVLYLKIDSGEKVEYRLISVIDHIGTDECGHYYCRCNYESETWWLLNDTQSKKMKNCTIKDIVTNNTIVFLFKRVLNVS